MISLSTRRDRIPLFRNMFLPVALCIFALACSAGGAQAGGARLSLVYSFQGFKLDGQWPKCSLLDVKGTLYGTTTFGGVNDLGSVFAIDSATGAETTLYSLPSDYSLGELPSSGLIMLNGKLYGTAVDEGAGYYGTAFSYDPQNGVGAAVYSFQGGNDGGWPVAGLIAVKGKLIGTTYIGGAYNQGTIFSVDPATGAETVLHGFQVNGSDGAYPLGGVLDYDGTLFGTTELGGTSNNCGVSGCGTIYALDPKTRAETILYSFQSPGTDGVSVLDAH